MLSFFAMSTIQTDKQNNHSEKRFSDLAVSPILYQTLVFIILLLVSCGRHVFNQLEFQCQVTELNLAGLIRL